MFDHDFHFGFDYLKEEETIEAPLRLTAVGVETEWDMEKVHDHKERPIYTYTFLYTISGSGIFETSDGQQYRCDENHAIFFFEPSETRRYTAPDSNGNWRYCWIMFIVNPTVKFYCQEIIKKASPVFYLAPNSMSILSMKDIIIRRRKGLLGSRYLMFAAVYDFICKLTHEITEEKNNYSPLVIEAMKIMDERYDRLQGIQEVADYLYVSQNYLTKVFKKEMSITPIKYLTEIRMSHALELLKSTKDTVESIARQCGYSSSSYFVKAFQNRMSLSPTDYRKKGGE